MKRRETSRSVEKRPRREPSSPGGLLVRRQTWFRGRSPLSWGGVRIILRDARAQNGRLSTVFPRKEGPRLAVAHGDARALAARRRAASRLTSRFRRGRASVPLHHPALPSLRTPRARFRRSRIQTRRAPAMPSAVDFDRAALDGADPAVRALVEEARAAKALAKRRREKLLESERVVAAQRAEAVKSAATIAALEKATRALLPGVATRRSVSTRAPIDAARTTDAPRDEDETAPPLTPPPPPRSTALAEFARASRARRDASPPSRPPRRTRGDASRCAPPRATPTDANTRAKPRR